MLIFFLRIMKNMFSLQFRVTPEVRQIQQKTDLEVYIVWYKVSSEEVYSHERNLESVHTWKTDSSTDCEEIWTEYEVGATTTEGH